MNKYSKFHKQLRSTHKCAWRLFAVWYHTAAHVNHYLVDLCKGGSHSHTHTNANTLSHRISITNVMRSLTSVCKGQGEGGGQIHPAGTYHFHQVP